MTEEKKLKVVFAPGCFDNFEGDQEELDELIKAIEKMAEDPEEMFSNAKEVNLDEIDDEILEALGRQIQLLDGDTDRKLH